MQHLSKCLDVQLCVHASIFMHRLTRTQSTAGAGIASSKDGLDQRTDSLRFSLYLPLKHHRHPLSIISFINSAIVNSNLRGEKDVYFIFLNRQPLHTVQKLRVISGGMETSCGQWLLVDTFFQNGRILVDIFSGWILVDTFCPQEFLFLGEFSWTYFCWSPC